MWNNSEATEKKQPGLEQSKPEPRTPEDSVCSTTSESENIKPAVMNNDGQEEQKAPENMTDILLGKKVIIVQKGNTINTNKTFMHRLKSQIPELHEVDKEEEADFILVFCPIVSRAGTDIEAALRKLQTISETKPAVLVVLHHTFNPECVVPESSRAVNRVNTITVDCLFHEDLGLLRCCKNHESLARIIKIIQAQTSKENSSTWSGIFSECILHLWRPSGSAPVEKQQSGVEEGKQQGPNTSEYEAKHSINKAKKEKNENDQCNENGKNDDWEFVYMSDCIPEPSMTSENQCDKVNKRNPQGQHLNEEIPHAYPGRKYFIYSTGKTAHSHMLIKNLQHQIKDLQEVFEVDKCDFILVFCPVVSRAGTDIEAALEELSNLSDTKPAVLVVLHHTLDPESIVPDSSSAVNRGNTTAVDDLFHEDQGLLPYPQNDESSAIVTNLIQSSVSRQTSRTSFPAPGSHAFLLVIPVKQPSRNGRGMLEKMEELFGERCWTNTMIIFTVTDEDQKKNIEEFIQSGDQEVQSLVEKCGNRFHCLNIKERGDGSQVSELLEKIEKMVEGSEFYCS